MGTEGPVLEAWVHSSRVPDAHGIELPSEKVRERLRQLSRPWVDAGYRGSGKRWAEEVLGLAVEDTRKQPKSGPQEVAEAWTMGWAKECREADRQKPMPPQGSVNKEQETDTADQNRRCLFPERYRSL